MVAQVEASAVCDAAHGGFITLPAYTTRRRHKNRKRRWHEQSPHSHALLRSRPTQLAREKLVVREQAAVFLERHVKTLRPGRMVKRKRSPSSR